MSPHARRGRTEFTVFNALILAVLVAIAGSVGIPLLESANHEAQSSSLRQSLRTLRSQIELYKVEHAGRPPLLRDGSLPQLLRATDATGNPGPAGGKFPLGPYLRSGIPINAATGRSIITATDTFPPETSSGNGGWLYHQPSGQIAVDLQEYLDQ